MIKQQIQQELKQALKDLGYQSTDPVVSISKFGDYSTNVALQLAKRNIKDSKQTPTEIAKKILSNLSHLSYLKKVEIAGGGFINFYIKPEYLTQDLKEILQKDKDFGRTNTHCKKARVEYVSANPTGPMHIGNGRGGPLGDTLANVLEFLGYAVVREYIHNDVGNQVTALGATIKAKLAGEELSEQHYKGEYVLELTKSLKGQIEGKSDEEVGQMAAELNFKSIMEDVAALGIRFNYIAIESKLQQDGSRIIGKLGSINVLKEKEGALWFAPQDEYLKDRETVLIRSDGRYTYFTSDIVYHSNKFESGADLIIDVFGADHFGHIPKLQAAMKALGYDVSKLKFLLYQYVRVKRGGKVVKISKRAGNIVTAREVLDEVGKDAFRFTMLSYAPSTHIDFNIDIIKQRSKDNPVYFVQYAYARMCSILKKADKLQADAEWSLLKERVELDLIKHLYEFPDIVEDVSSSLEPNKLTNYAYQLAEKFHRFYEACPVLSAVDDIQRGRLVVVKSCKIVLANTLALLGISAPERM